MWYDIRPADIVPQKPVPAGTGSSMRQGIHFPVAYAEPPQSAATCCRTQNKRSRLFWLDLLYPISRRLCNHAKTRRRIMIDTAPLMCNEIITKKDERTKSFLNQLIRLNVINSLR